MRYLVAVMFLIFPLLNTKGQTDPIKEDIAEAYSYAERFIELLESSKFLEASKMISPDHLSGFREQVMETAALGELEHEEVLSMFFMSQYSDYDDPIPKVLVQLGVSIPNLRKKIDERKLALIIKSIPPEEFYSLHLGAYPNTIEELSPRNVTSELVSYSKVESAEGERVYHLTIRTTLDTLENLTPSFKVITLEKISDQWFVHMDSDSIDTPKMIRLFAKEERESSAP